MGKKAPGSGSNTLSGNIYLQQMKRGGGGRHSGFTPPLFYS